MKEYKLRVTCSCKEWHWRLHSFFSVNAFLCFSSCCNISFFNFNFNLLPGFDPQTSWAASQSTETYDMPHPCPQFFYLLSFGFVNLKQNWALSIFNRLFTTIKIYHWQTFSQQYKIGDDVISSHSSEITNQTETCLKYYSGHLFFQF